MKDLLRIADLTADDLTYLLRTGQAFHHGRMETLLGRKTVVLYFAKPSTRTRISAETAVVRLGGVPIAVGPDELQLRRGETIADIARVISSYASAIVIRTYADADVRELATAASIPVINALTDGHHPLQAVADLITLKERFPDLAGRRIAYIGDGNNVAHSLMEAAALAGMDIAVATPFGYEPAADVIRFTEEEARRQGGHLILTEDPVEAVKDASAVYTDAWLSMGDAADERERRTRKLTPYRVDADLMAHARPEAVFMHCLPAHRGQEVTGQVIDGDQSVVFAQAASRLPATQAVLAALLGRKLEGRP